MPQIILRISDVIKQSGMPRSSLYGQIAKGLWPKPVAIGHRTVGWPAAEVEEMIAMRIAGRDPELIKAAARRLEALRENADQRFRGPRGGRHEQ